MSQQLFEAMTQSVIEGEVEEAERLAQLVLAEGIDPLEAINRGFIVGLDQVGEQFGCGNLFLPDMVQAAEAMKTAVAILEPEIARRGVTRQILGKIVIGTVEGDIHDIGKTLVATMLAASGFEVHDLGVNVPIAKLIQKAVEVEADIIAVSALLTTTMVKQKALIGELEARDLHSRLKVMIGGAPVTPAWAESIGADGYSEDAISAVALAKRLVGA
ncbi:MAG: hypothetical protein HC875_17960 [Anaerolineales bacterium]|nr:hypothetical protein [Anaerolineales bacterium]